MTRRLGELSVETVMAETEKFTAPLVFLHGLWCTAAVWRPWMGYLGHRGWTCHAVQLRRGGGSDLRWSDLLTDVDRALRACTATPIVIGHDLGGALALSCTPVRAVVALAPLLPGTDARRFTRPWTRLAPLRTASVAPPLGTGARALFADGPPGGVVAESAAVIRDWAAAPEWPLPGAAVPRLLVAGAHDTVASAAALQAAAPRIGATLRVAPDAGHALPWARGWEQRAAEVHRWIVRTLGEDLLALLEEAEE